MNFLAATQCLFKELLHNFDVYDIFGCSIIQQIEFYHAQPISMGNKLQNPIE